jgi:hypothetical protein
VRAARLAMLHAARRAPVRHARLKAAHYRPLAPINRETIADGAPRRISAIRRRCARNFEGQDPLKLILAGIMPAKPGQEL